MKALRGFLSRSALAAAVFAAYPGTVFPAIGVTDLNRITVEELVNSLVGCGVEVGDIKYIGAPEAAGVFTGGVGPKGEYVVGFEKGIVLSSGKAASVAGPNKSDGTTDTFSPDRSDFDLNKLIDPGDSTHDAVVLEFEFIPSSTYITFDYVFSSEEYNEYVYSFNDVFGFLLNGVNVAVLPRDPGTSATIPDIPVSIDNVNGGNPIGSNPNHAKYYINNDIDTARSPYNTEMDGLTVVLSVYATVKAGVRNKIKLAVADVNDQLLNTAVFIKAGSFSSKCSDSVVTTSTVFELPPVAASPNPYRPGSGGTQDAASMTFSNIPAGSTVRIYTPAGVLVNELSDTNRDGRVSWDARNGSGKPVASGVYIYAVREANGNVIRRKVVVIR